MDQTTPIIKELMTFPKPEVFFFFGYWQLVTCLFSAIALAGIWWHIGKKERESGMLWLSLAVLFWSFSGLVEIYYGYALQEVIDGRFNNSAGSAQNGSMQEQMAATNIHVESARSILSLFNSAFILLALPCFRHIPRPVLPIIKSPSWVFIVLFPFIISLCINFGILMGWFAPAETKFVNALDFVYAILVTLPFLGWILWESFDKRGLKILAWLSLLSIGLTVIAQFNKLNEDYLFAVISSSIFKPILIMLFFALVMSWVKELSERAQLSPKQLFLAFEKIKTSTGKFEHQVRLTLPPHFQFQTLRLTRSRFNLLLKFAERKLGAETEHEEWLEIKPKFETRANRPYDIKDHNEIKRLLDNLLEEVYPKSEVAKHRSFLKEALFETSEVEDRKIRLRIPKGHIEMA